MLGISLIGAGEQARLAEKILTKHKDIKINFILVRKNKKIHKPKFTKSIKNLLNSDMIYICVPPKENFNILKKLYKLNYKNYILSEKPVVHNAREMNLALKFKNSFKKKIFVNFNFQKSDIANLIKKNLKMKKNGKLKFLSFQITHGAAYKPGWKHGWRINSKLGPIEGMAIHFVQFMKHNFGKFKIAHSSLSSNAHKNKIDTSDTLIKFKNKSAFLRFSYSEPMHIYFELIFSNAKIIYDGTYFKYYLGRENLNKFGRFVVPKLINKYKIDFYKDWRYSISKNFSDIIKKIKNNKKNTLKQINSDISILKFFY
jgi:predicted dehydrogenase